MGTAYETLRAEKVQFAGALDAALVAMAGMKDVLVEREMSLEKAREANRALTAEVEKMKAQRSDLMGQMNVVNKRCIAQEKSVGDSARQMMTRLAGKSCFFRVLVLCTSHSALIVCLSCHCRFLHGR